MKRSSYFGNPWIGMFAATNDSITLIPADSMKKFEDVFADLGTEIMKVSVADTNLVGLYSAMNSNGIVLPNVANENESMMIKKSGLNVLVSGELNNAHGNNIAANDKGGIVNPRVAAKERKMMEDVLGIELVPMTVAGFHTVGSACIATTSGFLAHYRITDDEMDVLKGIFKVHGNKGTLNTGTGFVSYGAVVNKNGYVAGEASTAFELGRLEEAFGLIR